MRLCLGLIVSTLTTPTWAGYNAVYFDSSSCPVLENNSTLIFDGVRAKGSGVTLNDALRLEYNFDLPSLNFNLGNTLKYPKIGVFNSYHMAKDVSNLQPTMTVNGQPFSANIQKKFTSLYSNPFIAKITAQAGQVLSWNVENATSNFNYEFYGLNKNTKYSSPAQIGLISNPERILLSGDYYLKIIPSNAESVDFSIKLANANYRKLANLTSGMIINDSFTTNLYDYSKYKVSMKQGERLSLPAGSSDIRFKIINTLGTKLIDARGLGITFNAPANDTYYLFIENYKAWGGNYTGLATIKRPESNISVEHFTEQTTSTPTTLGEASASKPIKY